MSVLLRIFTTLRYLGRQGLALRGHEDSESNFKQLLLLRSDDSPELRKRLQRKKCYTSADVQEEILQLTADNILRKLAHTVRNIKFYRLIADETADISRIKQLVICIRSVNKISG